MYRAKETEALKAFVDKLNGARPDQEQDWTAEQLLEAAPFNAPDDEYDPETNPRGTQDPTIRAQSITYLVMRLCSETGPATFANEDDPRDAASDWNRYFPLARKVFKGFKVREPGAEEHNKHTLREEAYALLAEMIENDNSMGRSFEDNEDRMEQIWEELDLFDRARYFSRLGSLNDSLEDAERSWKLYLLADSNRYGVDARRQQKELGALCFDALHYKEVRAIVKTCKRRKAQRS